MVLVSAGLAGTVVALQPADPQSYQVAVADYEVGDFVEDALDGVVGDGPRTFMRASEYWDGCRPAAGRTTCTRHVTRYYGVEGGDVPALQRAWASRLRADEWTAGAGSGQFRFIGFKRSNEPTLRITWQQEPTMPATAASVPAGTTTRDVQAVDVPTIYRQTYAADFRYVVAVSVSATYFPVQYMPAPDPSPTPHP